MNNYASIDKPTDDLENLAIALQPVIKGSLSKDNTTFLFFNGLTDEEMRGHHDNPSKAGKGEGSDSKGGSQKKIHPIDGKTGEDTEARATGTE